jgi:3',5'-cyclic AMP phosphodiesterase CpdA
VGKRALGYANLTLNRGRTHKKEHLVNLVRAVAKEAADLVLVTGDFTSLSLDFEFQNINKLFLANGLTPDNTLVIPGNHDRYTVLADKLDAFESGMASWLPKGFRRRTGYPIFREVGPALVAALDTSVWRNPVRAAGVVDDAQLKRLTERLHQEGGRLWPVIALHHPPFSRGNRMLLHYRTGLAGYDRLIRGLKGIRATVIHGHLHVSCRRTTDGLDIIGVPSASNNTGEPSTQLAYHVYTVSAAGLDKAEAIRLWPDGDEPIERYELAQEIDPNASEPTESKMP